MERREFLQRFERTALGACALAASTSLPFVMGACASLPTVRGELRDGAVLLPLASLAADGTALVAVPGMDLPLFVRRIGVGKAIALSTRCMHRGCEVEPEAERLVCPCHGSEYTLDGAVLKGPTTRPLARFAVTETGEALVISLTPLVGA